MSDPFERDAEPDRSVDLVGLTEAADRLDGLADMADIMNDEAGADRFRAAASRARLRAMSLLDT